MPGTILLDDAQKLYTDRLQQHAQDAFAAIQQANQPPLQNVQVQPPSLPQPPQIDPNEITQRLQQHAQDALQALQQANQPPLQGVQIDPNDIAQRLQQHAQNAFQAVAQNVQPIAQGLQQANQPPFAQPAQPISQGVQEVQPPTPTGETTSPQPSQPPIERGGDLRAYARQAAQRAGIDPDIFVRQIDQESGFNVTAKSGAGAQGIAQFMPATAAGIGLDPSDPYASLDAAARMDADNLKRYGGDWGKTLAAYNAGPGAVDKYGGVPPFEETQRYVRTIIGSGQQAVQNVAQGAGQVLESGRQAVASAVLPTLSQFGDKQLTAAEAYAACGPAAAVRFAQMFGRNPTLREATDMASNVGWTADTGMAGLQSESKLFTDMGIPHRVVGADWKALAREAGSGNPVTISTPGHYFTADSYDPSSGAFHVGSSGTDLRGGSEWMTPTQMEARMGALQGGLAADNPGTPAPSPISGGTTPTTGIVGQARQAVQQGGRAISAGLQQVDNAVQGVVSGATGAVQGAAADVATCAGQTAQDVQQAVIPPLQEAAAGAQGRLQQVAPQSLEDLTSRIQTPENAPLGPVGQAIGTGASGLGTAVSTAGDVLKELSPATAISRVTTGLNQIAAEDPQFQQLQQDYRDAQQRMSADPSSANQQALVDAQNRLDQRVQDLRQGVSPAQASAVAFRSPQRESEETAANLIASGAATAVAPAGLASGLGRGIAAGVIDPSSLPFNLVGELATRGVGAVRALATMLQPGTSARDVAQAVQVVNDTPVTARALVDAIDQVRKMPGTAELAPVRAQVPQSSTDLLQAMLAAARAKGADPDKLTALEQQIAAMDPTAATRRALTPTGGVRGAISDFLTGTGSEVGAVSPRFGATLGGAVAGGYAGNATAPEDAEFRDRAARVIAGAGAGAALGSAAGFRGPLEQSVLQSLRSGGVVAGPARGAPLRGPIAEAVDLTKQSILTNPATHIANVIGNTIELARQPIALAMGGRGDDALAGLVSIGRGLPEAAGNAVSALRGNQLATLSTEASSIGRRSPIFRALSASDAFTRTLGEYQGMASEANRLLREAGMTPVDPGAASFLASHATDLYRQGTRAGAQSVFGRVASAGGGTGVLDNMFRTYSNAKEGLLNSPRLRDQAMGALMDFGIPFSGVPVQMLQIGLNRLPVATQATGAIRAVRALKAGNLGEAQRAVGETGLE